jgi:adenine-specific DNA-methyltransferase
VEANDKSILDALYKHPDIRRFFFATMDQFVLFDKEKFLQFLNSKEWLTDSYTGFRNQVQLVSRESGPLRAGHEVVLEWPFKDCVLQGGMEETEQKRPEVFFNQVLAPDEINKLLEPKAFRSLKQILPKKEAALEEFTFDSERIPNENLFIKGNNLMTLSSLLPRYAGKVKLIYIDPPYNTRGSDDSFKYNDSFNHSTWLTFMKNRLELAHKLLRPDGAIYVQLDYNEVHYCKVLMDEIFGRHNFQREIIWRIGWLSGYKTIENNWIRNHDTILFYSKDSSQLDFIKHYIPKAGDYKRRDDSESSNKGYAIEDTWNAYGIDSLSDYANDKLDSIAIISFSQEKVGNFKGQKNEALLKRIIAAHTREGDLVLDFFGGTGTTAAVAHKMNRRWILVEQMESQVELATKRLKKVLNGDNVGISKEVGWEGGGGYIYLELAERNPGFAKAISQARTTEELSKLLDKLTESPFISHQVDLKVVGDASATLKKLPLSQAKSLLFEILDKNAIFVNLSEIDDISIELSKNEISLTKSFYGMN